MPDGMALLALLCCLQISSARDLQPAFMDFSYSCENSKLAISKLVISLSEAERHPCAFLFLALSLLSM